MAQEVNNQQTSPNNLIELHDINRIFGIGEAESYALQNFYLQVKPGEFIMIMGSSGCGKTTLLNILGFLDRPTSGQYFLNQTPTSHFSSRRLAKLRSQKIGIIFQEYNLIPTLTVLENVALPLIYAGVSHTKAIIKASETLKNFDLQTKEYYYPYQLSGGQKQRVAIARALVANPEIILADEPTGSLDTKSSETVMQELHRVHQAGNTIIMVTHNPALTKYATRVLHMIDGSIDRDFKFVADHNLPERIDIHFNSKTSRPEAPQVINTEAPRVTKPETPRVTKPEIPRVAPEPKLEIPRPKITRSPPLILLNQNSFRILQKNLSINPSLTILVPFLNFQILLKSQPLLQSRNTSLLLKLKPNQLSLQFLKMNQKRLNAFPKLLLLLRSSVINLIPPSNLILILTKNLSLTLKNLLKRKVTNNVIVASHKLRHRPLFFEAPKITYISHLSWYRHRYR